MVVPIGYHMTMGLKPRQAPKARTPQWSGYATLEAKVIALADELSDDMAKKEAADVVRVFAGDVRDELAKRLPQTREGRAALDGLVDEFRRQLTIRLESARYEVALLVTQEIGGLLEPIIELEQSSGQIAEKRRADLTDEIDEIVGVWGTGHAEDEADDFWRALDEYAGDGDPAPS